MAVPRRQLGAVRAVLAPCEHCVPPVTALPGVFVEKNKKRRWLDTEPHLATHATRGDVLPLSAQEEILERFDIHSKRLFEDAPHERLGDQWETVPPRFLDLGTTAPLKRIRSSVNLWFDKVFGDVHLSPCPLEQVLGDDRPPDRRGRGHNSSWRALVMYTCWWLGVIHSRAPLRVEHSLRKSLVKAKPLP